MPILNLAGQKFGKLLAISREANRKGISYWVCQCDCGKVLKVALSSLRSGCSISCGCIKAARIASLNRTHGMTKTPEYSSWQDMKKRCLNPKSKSFKDYGARGIIVCQRWINSFEAFYEDMGPKPTRKHTVERVDNDGNYEPSNCVWTHTSLQNKNRRPFRRFLSNPEEYGYI